MQEDRKHARRKDLGGAELVEGASFHFTLPMPVTGDFYCSSDIYNVLGDITDWEHCNTP
jgi:hypothetical protein